MILSEIADYVTERISSDNITLKEYVTTDSLLQNKSGREIARNLPPMTCNLTRFQKGDILVSNIRPYLRKVWLADIDGGCSADVLVFRAKSGISPYFLHALLMQDGFFDYAMKGVKGSKMPRGDKNQLLRFPIRKFASDEMWQIGWLISNIDRKINLNRQINHNLEALAKQLYDYWFVQFDFPDENGRPYKSSGGEMIDGLPKGWSNGYLSEIATVTMGQSPEGTSYNNDGDGIIFYQGSTDFGMRFPKVRQYTTAPTRYASKGEILMSVRAPVGAVNIANNNCCIGRGLAALSPKNGSTTFLFYVISYLKESFDRINTSGTTFGAITKDELNNQKVILPDTTVVNNFEKICGDMFSRQMLLGEEIDKLTKLRDELLPMLMNGQVSVNYDLSSC